MHDWLKLMLKKTVKEFICLSKRFSYLFFFLFALLLMLIFKNINNAIAYNTSFIIIHCIIFIFLTVFFIVFLISYIIEQIKIKNLKKYNFWDNIYFTFITLFSVFLVFVVLKDNFTGIFGELRWIVGNVFIKDIFNETLWADPKTFTAVIYSVLQTIFHIKINIITVLTINKIIAVFLLIVVFLVSKEIFKNNIISLLVYVAFISASFLHWNIGTIAHSVNAMFFTYTSIIFLFVFIKQKNLNAFILSNICLLLAAYYRYELSILFGLPYLFYYCMFVKKYRQTRNYMIITTIILVLFPLFLVKSFTLFNDPDRLGTEIDNFNTISSIGQSVNILKYNVFIQKDLSLQSGSGHVTLFTYSGFLISLILTIGVIIRLIKKKEIKSKDSFVYIFAFYNLIYFIFVLIFTVHGLRSSSTYSVQYWLCEIIVTYFGILWLINKIISTRQKQMLKIVQIMTLLVFLLLAVNVSNPLSFEMHPLVDPEGTEIYLLKENVKLDSSCEIIKVHAGQPAIDLYFGLQKSSVFFGFPPEFYENIERYDKQDRCFYYYDQEYLTEHDYKYCYMFRIDKEKVNLLFKSCNKSIEYKSPLEDRPFSLIRYTC